VIHLAKEWNIKVLERMISIDEIFKTSKERKLKEAFGVGRQQSSLLWVRFITTKASHH